jgi:antitoxin component YwqK of YwqJK toxin-antitoxin module
VGNVDTSADTFVIVDPTTGVAISAVHTYTGDILQIDGAGVAAGQFENGINEGDTIAGTSANGVETWNLTNQTRTGTATNVDDSPGDPVVNFQIGNLGDDPASAQNDDYVAGDGAAGTETFTIDGASATAQQFKDRLNNGDTVAYSRTGGIETFALTNVAPAAQTGTLADGSGQEIDTGNDELIIINGTVDTPVDYTGSTSFSVNGTLVTETEFEAALTAGDSVTFTPDNPDTAANEQKIAVTNANLTGQIDDIDLGNTEYDVVNAEGNAIFNDLDYTGGEFGGTDRYVVNGTERTIDVFEDFLADIDAEPTPNSTDTITVIDAVASTDHQLTTDEDGA